jgi:hypothetical protein
MKKILMFSLWGTLTLLTSGCFVEAELTSLRSEMKPFEATDAIMVSPSFQDKVNDNSNTYQVRSAVGEVTSGVSHSDDNNYTAELSISYQRR